MPPMGLHGRMRRERERERRATSRTVRKQGTGVLTRSASSGEGGLSLPHLPLTRRPLDLDAWVPRCQGPQSANTG
jgi:hypothetical protein